MRAAGLPIDFHGWTDKVPEALHAVDVLAVPSALQKEQPASSWKPFRQVRRWLLDSSGGIPELVRHRETGLLTGSRTAGSLAATLETLLNDLALMQRLSFQGRASGSSASGWSAGSASWAI